MGKVVVEATLENLDDLFHAHKAEIQLDQVRTVTVANALVDTAASGLGLPKRMVAQLGLQHVRTRQALTTMGMATFQIYRAVRLTVQGRDCICDVAEVPDECPVLIGQVPLEIMDFIVDPGRQRLIGNPEHGGEQMLEMY